MQILKVIPWRSKVLHSTYVPLVKSPSVLAHEAEHTPEPEDGDFERENSMPAPRPASGALAKENTRRVISSRGAPVGRFCPLNSEICFVFALFHCNDYCLWPTTTASARALLGCE